MKTTPSSELVEQANSEDSRKQNLRIQLTDFLIEDGHTVNKLLTDSLANWVYGYSNALYAQGEIKGNGLQLNGPGIDTKAISKAQLDLLLRVEGIVGEDEQCLIIDDMPVTPHDVNTRIRNRLRTQIRDGLKELKHETNS